MPKAAARLHSCQTIECLARVDVNVLSSFPANIGFGFTGSALEDSPLAFDPCLRQPGVVPHMQLIGVARDTGGEMANLCETGTQGTSDEMN